MISHSKSSKGRIKTIPHYFKSDFPDQRFLPFRLLINRKKPTDEVPLITYFDSLYNQCSKTKKKSVKLSPIRSNRIFNDKEKIYKQIFTNGNVEIRTEYTPSIKFKGKSTAPINLEPKNSLKVPPIRSKSSKKTDIHMVDFDKKKERISSKRIKKNLNI
jgi:hypothetical protein